MKFLVLFIFICSYCFPQQENPIFIQVAECFQVVGGLDSLISRLQYPTEAKANGIEGKVYIQITVDTLGIPTNPIIIKSLGFGCDEEAIRLVLTANYIPAIINGKKVNSKCTMPIVFRLPKDAIRMDKNEVSPFVHVFTDEPIWVVGGPDSLQSRLIYPIEAIENRIEGNVYVLINIDTSGIPSNPYLIKGVGFGCDEEAIRLVLTAKYLPAIDDGKKIRSQTVVKVKFKLPFEE